MNRDAGRKAKVLIALMMLASSVGILLSRPDGSELAVTGDFGELSCNQTACHNSFALNAPGGTLTITGVPAEYEAGRTYTLTVTINKSGQKRWGFQLSSRYVSTQQAGNLVATDTFRTKVDTKSGIQYIHHSGFGTFPGDSGPKSWTFNWVAPASPLGAVRFSCAGNASNNDTTQLGDYIYTTTATSNPKASPFISTLFYPRLVTTDGMGIGLDSSQYTGIAVANLGTTNATLQFTSFDKTGAQITGTSITNPASKALNAGQQLPIVDSQVWGSGLPSKNPVGWFKLASTVSKMAGFFLMFNSSLSILDGADVSPNTLTSFILPEIEDQGFTQIHVANPNSDSASLTFELLKSDGTLRTSASRTVNGNGAVAEFFTDLFPGITPNGSDYIRVTSNRGVVPFELLGKTGQYVAGLNGQDANAGATTLYSPQYVVGGPDWRSTLSILNLDSTSGTMTIDVILDDGRVAGSRTLPIQARGKIYITDQKFFFDPGDTLTQGYLVIKADVKLAGSVVFGDPSRSTFSSALPLTSKVHTSIVFSQLASNQTYFTGLAIINPFISQDVTIEVYDANGVLIVSKVENIPTSRRKSQLLTQYFPVLIAQNHSSGYIKVTSAAGVASFALFGTQNLSVLSAVPPQVVP